MSNADEIVKLIISKVDKLPADKIMALGNVIKSLGEEVIVSDNTVKMENDSELTEDSPIDLSEVTGIQIDNAPARKVKVYKRENT